MAASRAGRPCFTSGIADRTAVSPKSQVAMMAGGGMIGVLTKAPKNYHGWELRQTGMSRRWLLSQATRLDDAGQENREIGECGRLIRLPDGGSKPTNFKV